jgi:hypothetical protein
MANPKMLFIFSKTLLSLFEENQPFIRKNTLLAAVREHLTGMKMINSLNVLDYMYLLQTLANLVAAGKGDA